MRMAVLHYRPATAEIGTRDKIIRLQRHQPVKFHLAHLGTHEGTPPQATVAAPEVLPHALLHLPKRGIRHDPTRLDRGLAKRFGIEELKAANSTRVTAAPQGGAAGYAFYRASRRISAAAYTRRKASGRSERVERTVSPLRFLQVSARFESSGHARLMVPPTYRLICPIAQPRG